MELIILSKYKYLFGPVPSRRLGRSLGVDIIPLKVCTQNCIYCQLGVNADTKVERAEYVNIDDVFAELKDAVENGLDADFITLTGSGEPTLNSRIGELIDLIKTITNIPVAILTNGNLLGDDDVRADCCKADVVMPSLDAGDAEMFNKMNRPNELVDFDKFIDGLCELREVYSGQIWLEVFFCDGVNTSNEQVGKMKSIIDRILPDKVQLNTSVRPTVETDAVRVDQGRLEEIAEIIGTKAEVIADYSKLKNTQTVSVDTDKVVELLKRRPCTLEDLCNGLNAGRNEVVKIISLLEFENKIGGTTKQNKLYYSIKS